MKTRKVEIEIPEGKKAVWKNEVLTLVDDKPQDVTERIKTFEDACAELGEEHLFVQEWDYWQGSCSLDLAAYLKLRIITTALNEGWEPLFTADELRYFPWFVQYTKEEIDKMREENKSHAALQLLSASYLNGGISGVVVDDGTSQTLSYSGSWLAFKTRDLAEYAGKQFADIYADFIFRPEKIIKTI